MYTPRIRRNWLAALLGEEQYSQPEIIRFVFILQIFERGKQQSESVLFLAGFGFDLFKKKQTGSVSYVLHSIMPNIDLYYEALTMTFSLKEFLRFYA